MKIYTDETIPPMARWDVSFSLGTPLQDEAHRLPDGVYEEIEYSRVPERQRRAIERTAERAGYAGYSPDLVLISAKSATDGGRYVKVTCFWRNEPVTQCA